MSSFLFSPLCLDPLQGVLDFTADAKPFRTKVIQAGVAISLGDTIKLSVVEQLYMDVDQLFHAHRGNCLPAPVPCSHNDGFESEVYDDEIGFEPTINYITVEYPVSTPTIGNPNFVGFSAAGNPVFIVVEDCLPPDTVCPEGFEIDAYDDAYFDSSDPECLRTCNNVYVDSCSSAEVICTDNSPTTLGTTFAEFLTIEDETGIILDVMGSTLFQPIYANNPVSNILDRIKTGTNQTIYPG